MELAKNFVNNSLKGATAMLKKIYQRLKSKGQGVVEYALLIGVVAVLTVSFFSNDGLVETFRTTLSNVVGHFTTFNSAYSNSS